MREMLNSRYDDLKSGKVKPIDGDEEEAFPLKAKTEAQRIALGMTGIRTSTRKPVSTSTTYANTLHRKIPTPPTASYWKFLTPFAPCSISPSGPQTPRPHLTASALHFGSRIPDSLRAGGKAPVGCRSHARTAQPPRDGRNPQRQRIVSGSPDVFLRYSLRVMSLKDVRADLDEGGEHLQSAAAGLNVLLGNDAPAETASEVGGQVAPETITKLQYFKIFRTYRLAEQKLLNHRLTWNLAIQGFLFATYGFSLQKLAEVEANPTFVTQVKLNFGVAQLKVLLVAIPLVGCVLSMFVWFAVRGAQLALKRLLDDWKENVEAQHPKPYLPDPAGAGEPLALRRGFFPPYFIPIAFVSRLALHTSLFIILDTGGTAAVMRLFATVVFPVPH